MKKQPVITLTPAELEELIARAMAPIMAELSEIKARLDLALGVDSPAAMPKNPQFKKLDRKAEREKRQAEIWESITRKRDAWVRKQRAAGKLP